MNKFTTFIFILLFGLSAFTQNVWDGSTISTLSTNGRLGIGTTSLGDFQAVLKNTGTTIKSALSIQHTNTVVGGQSGISNNLTFNGTSGYKYGISSAFVSQSSDANAAIALMVGGSDYGKRSGIQIHSIQGSNVDCAVYAALDGQLYFPSSNIWPTADRAGYFRGPVELVALDNDKAFMIKSGTSDVFRVYADGKVFATELNVLLASQFPDYVFHPNYTLMPLSDLSGFIKSNRHLPNMPTAAEIEQKGMNVGEVTTTLVEKVEELTLYILQQQERLDQQQKEIDSLKRLMPNNQ
jgi:hypothetical protein